MQPTSVSVVFVTTSTMDSTRITRAMTVPTVNGGHFISILLVLLSLLWSLGPLGLLFLSTAVELALAFLYSTYCKGEQVGSLLYELQNMCIW